MWVKIFEGNIWCLLGAMSIVGACLYWLIRFICNIKEGRIDGFWDAAIPVALILVSICIAILCFANYIDSLPSKCNSCGQAVNANYCTNCGSPAHKPETVYVCENCHKEIDTNYCGDCGGKKVLYAPVEVSPAD